MKKVFPDLQSKSDPDTLFKNFQTNIKTRYSADFSYVKSALHLVFLIDSSFLEGVWGNLFFKKGFTNSHPQIIIMI